MNKFCQKYTRNFTFKQEKIYFLYNCTTLAYIRARKSIFNHKFVDEQLYLPIQNGANQSKNQLFLQ